MCEHGYFDSRLPALARCLPQVKVAPRRRWMTFSLLICNGLSRHGCSQSQIDQQMYRQTPNIIESCFRSGISSPEKASPSIGGMGHILLYF